MTEARHLYETHAPGLEDFWGRRDDGLLQARLFEVFGRAVELASNEAAVLSAVDHSLPLFSTVPPGDRAPFRIEVVARALDVPETTDLEAITRSIVYAGQDDWISMQLGPWGFAHADLTHGRASVVVDHRLAARPELFSRAVLNTILLNFCLGNGFAMLHASCLVRDGRVLLLMAPHNTGKSTTALHLIRAGYALVSDSMVHVAPDSAAPLLAGFPTRRIKLRADMLGAFPEFHDHISTELVRDETKYVVDLTQVDPNYCVTAAVEATDITLCLLERQESPDTLWQPAPPAAVMTAVMHNSLFYDSWPIWEKNLAGIERLLTGARAYRLAIGSDTAALVAAVESLWGEGGR